MTNRRLSPIAAHRQLARLLRQARLDAGVTAAVAGERVQRDNSHISRIERWIYKPSAGNIEVLLTFYQEQLVEKISKETGAPSADRSIVELIPRALDLSRQSRKKPWYASYGDLIPEKFGLFLGLEEGARQIRIFATSIPGIVQTPEYARVVIEAGIMSMSEADVTRKVELRMKRQEYITNSEEPPSLNIVIDEAALHRMVGGPSVMAGQLQYLAKLSGQRGVTIQVLPFARGVHPALEGGFIVLDLPALFLEANEIADEADHIVVYTESVVGSVVYDQPLATKTFTKAFGRVSSEALPSTETRDLLLTLARDST